RAWSASTLYYQVDGDFIHFFLPLQDFAPAWCRVYPRIVSGTPPCLLGRGSAGATGHPVGVTRDEADNAPPRRAQTGNARRSLRHQGSPEYRHPPPTLRGSANPGPERGRSRRARIRGPIDQGTGPSGPFQETRVWRINNPGRIPRRSWAVRNSPGAEAA